MQITGNFLDDPKEHHITSPTGLFLLPKFASLERGFLLRYLRSELSKDSLLLTIQFKPRGLTASGFFQSKINQKEGLPVMP